MPVPKHIFDPPFNIVRCSHVVLGVTDLARARAFYEDTLGPARRGRDGGRALPARRWRSGSTTRWCCSKSAVRRCALSLGFKVGSEEDLDKAAHFFKAQGPRGTPSSSAPYQGRTLQASIPSGHADRALLRDGEARAAAAAVRPLQGRAAAAARPLQRVRARAAGHARLLRRASASGSPSTPRRTARTAASPPPGCTARATCTTSPSPTAAARACTTWPTGRRAPLNIIHLCDVMATTGYLAEPGARPGPARHLQRLLPLRALSRTATASRSTRPTTRPWTPTTSRSAGRLRDPRRQTLWGQPAPRSWFEEGTLFAGTETREALFKANVIIAD